MELQITLVEIDYLLFSGVSLIKNSQISHMIANVY